MSNTEEEGEWISVDKSSRLRDLYIYLRDSMSKCCWMLKAVSDNMRVGVCTNINPWYLFFLGNGG